MSKILTQGQWAVMAKETVDMEDTPFTNVNCSIIYAANNTFKSWVPGRELNAFTSLEGGNGYIIYVKQGQTIDVSDLFASVEDLGGEAEVWRVANLSGGVLPVELRQAGEVIDTYNIPNNEFRSFKVSDFGETGDYLTISGGDIPNYGSPNLYQTHISTSGGNVSRPETTGIVSGINKTDTMFYGIQTTILFVNL